MGNNTPQRQGDIKHYYSPCRVAVLLPHEMLLDYVVSGVVIQTTHFSYLLTTTLTTLPLGNNTPQQQGDIKHYFSPRRVAVLLPHEMLLDYVVSVVVIQTSHFSYLLTTTLTTLPLGNNIPQRQGGY